MHGLSVGCHWTTVLKQPHEMWMTWCTYMLWQLLFSKKQNIQSRCQKDPYKTWHQIAVLWMGSFSQVQLVRIIFWQIKKVYFAYFKFYTYKKVWLEAKCVFKNTLSAGCYGFAGGYGCQRLLDSVGDRVNVFIQNWKFRLIKIINKLYVTWEYVNNAAASIEHKRIQFSREIIGNKIGNNFKIVHPKMNICLKCTHPLRAFHR